ncbi:hypothetical protein N825_19340 [Skermanella stibiiresistens SB22]|uniref:Uncharacterized protein n=1 Tax=Skermanella stibiiresistens SB22 TaxID=1385369 RepID=W9HC93_9PROT|nr:hypothetical protein [Skermanella stibiiresistens]EWY42346.1 hypothetical protein N825_19340 [Skermanella stibiiresistens SB22]
MPVPEAQDILLSEITQAYRHASAPAGTYTENTKRINELRAISAPMISEWSGHFSHYIRSLRAGTECEGAELALRGCVAAGSASGIMGVLAMIRTLDQVSASEQDRLRSTMAAFGLARLLVRVNTSWVELNAADNTQAKEILAFLNTRQLTFREKSYRADKLEAEILHQKVMRDRPDVPDSLTNRSVNFATFSGRLVEAVDMEPVEALRHLHPTTLEAWRSLAASRAWAIANLAMVPDLLKRREQGLSMFPATSASQH